MAEALLCVPTELAWLRFGRAGYPRPAATPAGAPVTARLGALMAGAALVEARLAKLEQLAAARPPQTAACSSSRLQRLASGLATVERRLQALEVAAAAAAGGSGGGGTARHATAVAAAAGGAEGVPAELPARSCLPQDLLPPVVTWAECWQLCGAAAGPSKLDGSTRLRVASAATALGLTATFALVPDEYYQLPLPARAALLCGGGTALTSQLCKTIIVENRRREALPGDTNLGCTGELGTSKYIAVVLQYGERFKKEKLERLIRQVPPRQ